MSNFIKRNCLVLTQSRNSSEYNDFIGRFYHFPEKYLGQFNSLPAEFVYYESSKTGEGVYFGYGKIKNGPTKDKKEDGHYFIEITDYKPFSEPVFFKDDTGTIKEAGFPNYNPRNAVRKISPELLDEICLDGKIQLNFMADAHLIKVLGEQLIASEKIGILELIKNAYDAGASYCRVIIEKVPTLPDVDKSKYRFGQYEGPVIVIEDDGVGMDRATIENGWLRPASTFKTNVKQTLKDAVRSGSPERSSAQKRIVEQIKKAFGGRIPLGEKGVGRFATHRLGRRLLVKTKTDKLEYEYVLSIDWDQFDKGSEAGSTLEDIGVYLTRQSPSRNYGKKNSGTQIIIYGGRDGFVWSDSDIRKDLNSSILSLNSPHPHPRADKEIFKVSLECPQIGELSTENWSKEFKPNFSFDGFINEKGLLNYTMKFQPPQEALMSSEEIKKSFDLKSDKGYWRSADGKKIRNPQCGPLYFHIDIWYRTEPWIDGPSKKEFIDYLTKFGGISIFRDGINVFPAEWGANTDWLELSKRHIMRGRHISYYNFIGNLEINQITNSELIDKTDREGLIENTAFKDLKKMLHAAIVGPIETEFTAKRDRYTELTSDVVREPRVLTQQTKQGASLVNSIAENYPVKKDPYKILSDFGESEERKEKLINLANSLKNLQESIKLLEQSKELLTEQAGYGLAVAVSVHEIAKITANFYVGVSQLVKSKKFDKAKLTDLQKASLSLQGELKRLSPLRAIKTENRVEFHISKVIHYISEIFKNRFKKLEIEFKIVGKDDFSIYARYGALAQVLSNLIDNSCYWLDSPEIKKRKIIVEVDSKHRTILVADSGPGIHDIVLPYLFQPGYSLKIPASGLGLYISKYYMQSMHGDIRLAVERERLFGMKGAQFVLDFRRVLKEEKKDKK